MKITAWEFLLVQLNKNSAPDSLGCQGAFFGFGTVAPKNAIRLAKLAFALDPIQNRFVSAAVSEDVI
jgi:hypothetical protein